MDNSFGIYEGEYRVEALQVSGNGSLTLRLDQAIPAQHRRLVTVMVQGQRFHAEDNTQTSGASLVWPNSGLSWDDGDRVWVGVGLRAEPGCAGRADASLNPTDLRAFPGDGVLTLAWVNPQADGVVEHVVRWRKSGATSWLNRHGAVGDWFKRPPNYTHDITGLDGGAAYEAQVRILHQGGCSQWVSVSGTPESPADQVFWQSPLNVRDTGSGIPGCSNFSSTPSFACSDTSTLLIDGFTYGYARYEIERLVLEDGALIIDFSRHIADEAFLANLALQVVGGEVFPLSSGRRDRYNNKRLIIDNTGLSWSAGDAVYLALVGGKLPTQITVTAGGGALREGGPAVNVFLTLDQAAPSAAKGTMGTYDP